MSDTLEFRVREDIRCHKENGVDLNPFSTPGMRWSWQKGFCSLAVAPFSDAAYDRGRLAAKLIKEESE